MWKLLELWLTLSVNLSTGVLNLKKDDFVTEHLMTVLSVGNHAASWWELVDALIDHSHSIGYKHCHIALT
jgi:hypothetical protein